MTNKNQVIFIHGALSSPQSWNYIKHLAKPYLDLYDVHDFSYKITERSAFDLSKELSDLIKKVTANGNECFLIGHSFGGVLAIDAVRHFADSNGYNSKTGLCTIMTISSPLGGSGAASMLRVFKPTSMLYKNVGAYESFMLSFKSRKLPCKVYSIITSEAEHADFLPGTGKNDGVVTVESQEYFNKDPLITYKYVKNNHFEILLSPTVAHLVGLIIDHIPLKDINGNKNSLRFN